MAVRLNFLSVKPEACLPNSLCRVALPLAVLLCGAVGQAAEVHPLAVQQTRYEMRVGESVFDELRDKWKQKIGIKQLERLESDLATLVGPSPVRAETPGWIAHGTGV